VNQAEFADVLIDLFVQCEDLFLAASDTMRNFEFNSYPGFKQYDTDYELEYNGKPFVMRIMLNMVKPDGGRGYKSLNVYLYQGDHYNRRYVGKTLMFWMQDDPEFGFDYRIWMSDSWNTEMAEIIALFRKRFLEIAPGLILFELARIKPDAQSKSDAQPITTAT